MYKSTSRYDNMITALTGKSAHRDNIVPIALQVSDHNLRVGYLSGACKLLDSEIG